MINEEIYNQKEQNRYLNTVDYAFTVEHETRKILKVYFIIIFFLDSLFILLFLYSLFKKDMEGFLMFFGASMIILFISIVPYFICPKVIRPTRLCINGNKITVFYWDKEKYTLNLEEIDWIKIEIYHDMLYKARNPKRRHTRIMIKAADVIFGMMTGFDIHIKGPNGIIFVNQAFDNADYFLDYIQQNVNPNKILRTEIDPQNHNEEE